MDESVIDEMVAEIASAGEVYRPSNIWSELVVTHRELLRKHGIERFKKTLNRSYADEKIHSRTAHQFKSLAALLGRDRPLGRFQVASAPLACTSEGASTYGSFVSMLWDHGRDLAENILEGLDEPELGDPNIIYYDGRSISQDLARSVIEYATLRQFLPDFPSGPDRLVGEIGPGYGRLAYVFARQSACRYAFFDIPPALYVAQWYFGKLFGPETVAEFRRHRDFADIRRHISGKRFLFFTSNQLELFPADSFDLTINVDSLGEMQPESVRAYVRQMSRLTRPGGDIYLRNLRPENESVLGKTKWLIPELKNYRPPGDWRESLCRVWPVDERYFEAVFSRASA